MKSYWKGHYSRRNFLPRDMLEGCVAEEGGEDLTRGGGWQKGSEELERQCDRWRIV